MNLFKKHPLYHGDVVSLRLSYHLDESRYDIETYVYDILYQELYVGYIDLRMDNKGFMYYYGNIGYSILEEYRGNGFAYHACKLLNDVARDEFGLNELMITCSPDNLPSIKTIEKLNAIYIETVDVPINHELYFRGERVKNIYRIKL